MPSSHPTWTPRSFQTFVLSEAKQLYRDLPWRNTFDAYKIWISETMLQQTQVSRVDGRWQQWLHTFPTLPALAGAPTPTVLAEWQGLGYNRRALNLKRAAQACVEQHNSYLPTTEQALLALPGIGPATAAGITIFAYQKPAIYLETNVRAVLLHYLYPDAVAVPDKELRQALAHVQPKDPALIRSFTYALLDIGANLKHTHPNPSRRSATHTRQSRFEGSHRQKRATLLRLLLDDPARAYTFLEVSELLSGAEKRANRPQVSEQETLSILEELTNEGFLQKVTPFGAQSEVAWKCSEQ